jgi:hypothetical protein
MDTLKGMRLLMVCPTYGPPDPRCQQELRVGMMQAAKYGAVWEGDASPDRMGFSDARNTGAQALLETEANGIMWVDSDIRQDPLDMTKLLASAAHYERDFVTGVYHQRRPPYDPCFYIFDEEKNLFVGPEEYPPATFDPIDGCGFGFVYTSRKLIEAVARSPKFDDQQGWFPDRRDVDGWGEDLSFCYQVKFNTSYRLYVNTAIVVGHLGDPEVIYKKTPEEVKKAQAGVEPLGKWGFRDASSRQ